MGKDGAGFSGLGLDGLRGLGLELAQAGQGMFPGSPQASQLQLLGFRWVPCPYTEDPLYPKLSTL